DSDAKRRGLSEGDQLLSFAGRPMTTVNQYKNVLGLYPRGWRVPMVYRRDNARNEVLVRLMGVQRMSLDDRPAPRPGPGPRPGPVPGGGSSPAAKFYKAKKGFANYYFNEEGQKRLLKSFAANGDFSKLQGNWTFRMEGKLEGADETIKARIDIS